MGLNNLKPADRSKFKKKRVGRGPGSGLGKTSGRGHKGAQSRSGYHFKRGFEGGQMPLHRRLPKRGFTNIFRTEYNVLNLGSLADVTETELTLEKLAELGLTKKKGLLKILGNGEIKTAITIHAHKFSKSAQEKIERAGGKAVVLGGAPAQG